MIAEVTHTERTVLRNVDGTVDGVAEHSWTEPAADHARHRAAEIDAQRRAAGQRSLLQGQVEQFRARIAELENEVVEVRAETLRREAQLRSEYESQRGTAPVPIRMHPPKAGQLALDYIALLASTERDLAEIERAAGRQPPRLELWLLPAVAGTADAEAAK